MKVRVNHTGALNWGQLKKVVELEEEVHEEIAMDSNEGIVVTDRESALISKRPAMTIERMHSLGADRYFSIPRQNYQFLEWLVSQGIWSERFKWVRELPYCYMCAHNTPAVFMAFYRRQNIALCPDHFMSSGYSITTVLFKEYT